MSLHLYLLILGAVGVIVLIVVAWCIYASASLEDFQSEADWTLWRESARR